MESKKLKLFREKILDMGREHFRPMPWRENTDPYYVLVSEVMLQQTQVDRVIPKFLEFIKAFPTISSLAGASFQQVLAHWSGLGYNRRALWLHAAAKIINEKHLGSMPRDVEVLDELPGIGPNTAAAIMVYAFNVPVVFIETNIRSVFIHEFFADASGVHDKEILPLIEQSLDHEHPREWYWALMDYGALIKKQNPNPSRKSMHYTKQSAFSGSNRQVRGNILRLLLADKLDLEQLSEKLTIPSARLEKTIKQLSNDGLIVKDEEGVYSVSS